jgi:hypothetical protein
MLNVKVARTALISLKKVLSHRKQPDSIPSRGEKFSSFLCCIQISFGPI